MMKKNHFCLSVFECLDTDDPVCGTDRKEYRNACFAKRENAEVNCKGNCPCTKGKYEKTSSNKATL